MNGETHGDRDLVPPPRLIDEKWEIYLAVSSPMDFSCEDCGCEECECEETDKA